MSLCKQIRFMTCEGQDKRLRTVAATHDLDVSEVIRAAIELALPFLEETPSSIKILQPGVLAKNISGAAK